LTIPRADCIVQPAKPYQFRIVVWITEIDIAIVGAATGRKATQFLRAAVARGCPIQVGADMLFHMIPAFLEFFGFGTAKEDDPR
jgi:hypothetical protein